ncbi:MAG: hypothetical protein ABGZ24_18750, partial [Fuerstiella sp.]
MKTHFLSPFAVADEAFTFWTCSLEWGKVHERRPTTLREREYRCYRSENVTSRKRSTTEFRTPSPAHSFFLMGQDERRGSACP